MLKNVDFIVSDSSLSEIRVPDNDMINQSSRGTLSKEVKSEALYLRLA